MQWFFSQKKKMKNPKSNWQMRSGKKLNVHEQNGLVAIYIYIENKNVHWKQKKKRQNQITSYSKGKRFFSCLMFIRSASVIWLVLAKAKTKQKKEYKEMNENKKKFWANTTVRLAESEWETIRAKTRKTTAHIYTTLKYLGDGRKPAFHCVSALRCCTVL